MKSKKTVTLTIDRDLLRKIQTLARIDRRSISNYVEGLIKAHVEGQMDGQYQIMLRD